MQKSCRQCAQQFEITSDDLAFYDKVSPVIGGKKFPVPPPTLCPACRRQRRLSFRNERRLYHRKCDLCKKEMISMYSPDKPFTVYCHKCWWSDKYDPTAYGRDYDFSRPFFAQILELMEVTPLQTLISSPDAEENNCAYINFAGFSKNCYMVFDSDYNEDSYYSNVLKHSKNCVDCSYVHSSELCYECTDCAKCYNLQYSQDCTACSDGYFLKNCAGCTDCAFSSNLVRKKYHIFNKPYSKEEYFERLGKLLPGTRSSVTERRADFDAHKLLYPQKYQHSVNSENVSGDYINNAKNCADSYNIGDAEDLSHCDSVYGAKDCCDVSSFGEKIEKIYEGGTIGINAYDVLFSYQCVENVNGLVYCMHARNSRNCFGCVAIKTNKYCILNRQYSKEEYEEIVPRIIEHMKKTSATAGQTGEWGEYFPHSLSAFGYNETIAGDTFPLSKEAALKMGAKWKDTEEENRYQGEVVEIPDSIDAVEDGITKRILTCRSCKGNYKVIPQELAFYKEKRLPIPERCLHCRHLDRMSLRNRQTLYDRACAKCKAPIRTTYAPDRPAAPLSGEPRSGGEIVYCEKCYLKEVY